MYVQLCKYVAKVGNTKILDFIFNKSLTIYPAKKSSQSALKLVYLDTF